ncbi:MAG: universal stress protein [Rhodospirillales bacterium]|jgi:nucleotide-binding universal stress UspA family protein|nr:universal stress protein [Rhodospirillales bacterium]
MEPPFVLVLLASTTGATECLSIATKVSATLGRPIQLAHVQVGPGSIILPSQETLSEYEAEHLADREQAETEAIRALVGSWTHSSGIETSLDVFRGDEWRVMRHYRGKVSLVVLASPHTQPIGHRETLRAALLRTGHPVVMVPPGWAGGFGGRLLVGWEDVPPLRRAITAFAPFLSAAAQVDVVAVEQPEASLDLARTVIDPIAPNATYRLVAAGGRRTAAVLLDEAREGQADGLVMGAFRRGEILNWLAPGTSSRLIHDSFLPLLMSP